MRDLQLILSKAKAFEDEAHRLLGRVESAKSRVIDVDQTRTRVATLSLRQDELFRQAIECVTFGLFRGAHVMAWAGFIDYLEEKLSSDGLTKVRAARPEWSKFKTMEEITENVPEAQLIDVARDIGLVGKSEGKVLHGLLSKRNECAHPTGYCPGLNESLGFISELLNRVEKLSTRTL